jgi:hypothetical protein
MERRLGLGRKVPTAVVEENGSRYGVPLTVGGDCSACAADHSVDVRQTGRVNESQDGDPELS